MISIDVLIFIQLEKKLKEYFHMKICIGIIPIYELAIL